MSGTAPADAAGMTTDLLTQTDGALGRLRLNRPEALHALTLAMCQGMIAALDAWRDDESVEAVMIDHAPAPDGDPKRARGFCAGGDIRMLADSGATDGADARAFFHTEYRLNHRLFTYAKPTVAMNKRIKRSTTLLTSWRGLCPLLSTAHVACPWLPLLRLDQS